MLETVSLEQDELEHPCDCERGAPLFSGKTDSENAQSEKRESSIGRCHKVCDAATVDVRRDC
jgi:hypothetical protein